MRLTALRAKRKQQGSARRSRLQGDRPIDFYQLLDDLRRQIIEHREETRLLHALIKEIGTKLDQNAQAISDLTTAVTALEATQASNAQAFAALSTQLTTFDADLKTLLSKVGPTNPDDSAEIEALTARVTALSTAQTAAAQELAAKTADLAADDALVNPPAATPAPAPAAGSTTPPAASS